MIHHRCGLARVRLWSALVLLCCGAAGCSLDDVETTYGKSRGKSINGTNALAGLLRGRGHTVRAAIRYNEVLGDWARTIIRFAPYPGPPARQEAEWLADWLAEKPGRKLVYVPQDYDAAPEFWAKMIAALPATMPGPERQKFEARRTAAADWTTRLPRRDRQPATVADWFGTEPGDAKKPDDVQVCRELTGAWADGVDSRAAAIPRREVLRADNDERVLLSGDGKKLIVSWSFRNEDDEADDSSVLIVANGSFLVNGGLLERGRRPLAERVVGWVGDGPTNVAFVEGSGVVADLDDAAATTPFHLLTVEPFNWVAAHLAAFGVLLCLSLAVRIGRPHPEPAGEVERPSAHPVALGAILARTGREDLARELLAQYRQWRQASASTARTKSSSPFPRRVPRP